MRPPYWKSKAWIKSPMSTTGNEAQPIMMPTKPLSIRWTVLGPMFMWMKEAMKKAAVMTAVLGRFSSLRRLRPMPTPATVKTAPAAKTGIESTPSEMCMGYSFW